MLSWKAEVSLEFHIKTFKDTVSISKQLADELRVLKYMNELLIVTTIGLITDL